MMEVINDSGTMLDTAFNGLRFRLQTPSAFVCCDRAILNAYTSGFYSFFSITYHVSFHVPIDSFTGLSFPARHQINILSHEN